MGSNEEKLKRSKRRADKRRHEVYGHRPKNERDALPRLHKDYKDNKKNKEYVYSEDDDGGISR